MSVSSQETFAISALESLKSRARALSLCAQFRRYPAEGPATGPDGEHELVEPFSVASARFASYSSIHDGSQHIQNVDEVLERVEEEFRRSLVADGWALRELIASRCFHQISQLSINEMSTKHYVILAKLLDFVAQLEQPARSNGLRLQPEEIDILVGLVAEIAKVSQKRKHDE